MKQRSFEEFEATSLYCPRCKAAVPVRKRLLLVLPRAMNMNICVPTVPRRSERRSARMPPRSSSSSNLKNPRNLSTFIHPFGRAKLRLSRRGREARLRVNLQQAPAFRAGSREVHSSLLCHPFLCSDKSVITSRIPLPIRCIFGWVYFCLSPSWQVGT